MALGFGKGKEDDVVSLIAAKKYARAIEVLKAQLRKKGANPSLRMQLADVLILADKKQEAIGAADPARRPVRARGLRRQGGLGPQEDPEDRPGPPRRRGSGSRARSRRSSARPPRCRSRARAGRRAARRRGGFADGPALEIGFDDRADLGPRRPVALPPAAARRCPHGAPSPDAPARAPRRCRRSSSEQPPFAGAAAAARPAVPGRSPLEVEPAARPGRARGAQASRRPAPRTGRIDAAGRGDRGLRPALLAGDGRGRRGRSTSPLEAELVEEAATAASRCPRASSPTS